MIKYESPYVIIHSHANSCDIGSSLNNYYDLSVSLKINVVGYDYNGYGLSKGKAGDLNCIKNLISVYMYVNEKLKYDWTNIILYG